MKVIGLTGGIATGKSAVSKILQDLGAPIIDADLIAREVVKPGEKAWLEVVYAFGRDILHEDGDLDRKKLGKIVFGNREAMEKLNRITHPVIIQQINDRIERLRKESNYKAVFVVVPLLFEAGMENIMDEVWVVKADPETQLKRLILRENLTPEEARQRINSQMPLAEKLARADKIIDNSGNMEKTRRETIALWEGLA